jgi:hypothetical protein
MPQKPFRWNEIAGRYIGPDGRFVTFRRVRGYLDYALDSSEQKMLALGESLRTGAIGIEQWQVGMRDALKDTHLASSALAKGGWGQMSQADYGRVGFRLKEQYAYLGRFAKQIEGGLPLDGRFMNRIRLYAQSGRTTYHMVERAEQALRGMTEERNILGAADHCTECVSETDRGWVPIGDIVLVGMRICKSNCRCHLEYQ